MTSKDDHIAALEDEVRAARETIRSLTDIIKEQAKKDHKIQINKYPTYPYWWDGRTWYYQTPTVTYLQGTGGTTTNTYTFNTKPDDDGDGIQVSNVG